MIPTNHTNLFPGPFYSESTIDGNHSPGTVPATGLTQDHRTVSVLPSTWPSLLQLPPEIKTVLCHQLPFRDIVALSQTCKTLYTFIEEEKLVCRKWFLHWLPPASREKFRVAANSLTLPEVEACIKQFSVSQQLIDHCRSVHGSQYFPEFLFFHMMQLTMNCRRFKVNATQLFYYGFDLVTKATFSPNGHHIVSTNGCNTSTIHSMHSKGYWETKATILDLPDYVRLEAIFSPNSRHLALVGFDSSFKSHIQIYDISDDEQWTKAISIPIPFDYAKSLADISLSSIFFNNSQNIISISKDEERKLTVYGLDNNGKWLPDPVSSHSFNVMLISHSPDGLHGVVTQQVNTRPNYSSFCKIEFFAISGHNWLPRNSFESNYVYKLFFSSDSRHVMTAHGTLATIYGIDSNGRWELIRNIDHKDDGANLSLLRCAAFSPDGRYLATALSNSSKIRISGLDINGQWHPITTIDHNDDNIRKISFSPDSRHIATSGFNKYIRIYGVDDNGHCTLKTSIYHHDYFTYLDFSPDGCHLVTGCFSGQIKITGLLADRTWLEKEVIPEENGTNYFRKNRKVFSIKFSPCGFQVLLGCEDGQVSVYTPRRYDSQHQ